MPTIIASKEEFIKMLDRDMKHDEVIVWTTELGGTLTNSPKSGVIKLPFVFSNDAIKGLKPIILGHVGFFAAICGPREAFTEAILKKFDARKLPKKEKAVANKKIK